MLFPQLAKLRAWLEIKPDIIKELDHPTFRNEDGRPTSDFFYHTTVGSLLYKSRLVTFIGKRLGLADRPEEFEYYYTAYHNSALFGEVLDKLGGVEKLRIGPRFSAKLTRQEWAVLKRDYFFGMVSLLNRHGSAYQLSQLTDQFFMHHLFSITFPTKFKRSVQQWCQSVAEARYGDDPIKERSRQDGGQVVFQLLLAGEPVITLQGSSIKTLRGKAYKKLLVRLLDIPAEQEQDDGIEVIRIRKGEELPAGLLEQLDTTPWGAELPDEEEEPAVELRLSPRQQQELQEQEPTRPLLRRRRKD
jgi:hypothetical protein